LKRKYLIFSAFSLLLLFTSTGLILSTVYGYSTYNSYFNSSEDYLSKLDISLIDKLNDPNVKEVPIIILFKEDSSIKQSVEEVKLSLQNGYSRLREYSIIPGISITVDKMDIGKIARISNVKSIFLDKEYSLPKLSDLVNLNSKRELYTYSSGRDAIRATDVPYNGSGIKVAIIDTGINDTHPDLEGKVINAKSFVEDEDETDLNGHGTHVAGIVAGKGTASDGVYKGVASGALLINAKCFGVQGIGLTSNIIAAVEWAVNVGADILSMSLGGGLPDPDDPLSIAVENAVKQGILVVVAAGNSGDQGYFSGKSPGAARGVITVGASDLDDNIATFSSRGPTLDNRVDPDVVAPGQDIVSTLAPGSIFDAVAEIYGAVDRISSNIAGYYYVKLSGTSMATPHVAGAAAILMEAFPNLKTNPYAIKAALMETADDLGEPENIQGAGRINVNASLAYLESINQTSGFVEATTVLPKSIPLDPWSLRFPGDTLTVNLTFTTGKPVTLTVTSDTSLNASNFLVFGNQTGYYSDTWDVYVENETFIDVKIEIPLNASLGTYIGTLSLYNGSQLLFNISISFQVSLPIGKIYFDKFHNYDFQDSPLINYLDFMNEMGALGYDIDYGEYLLTPELLSAYDIVILPDLELQLTSSEINALQNYVSNGGSLLVLGSYYPMFVAESLNMVLQPYGIQYSTSYSDNLLDVNDYGMSRTYNLIEVTDIETTELTQGVSKYTLGSGLALNVDSSAIVDARYNDKVVLAHIDTLPSSKGGRVVVFGNELTFYQNILESSGEDNLKLVQNVINWLLDKEDVYIGIQVDKFYFQTADNETVTIGVYVSTSSGTPIPELENGTNIYCLVNDSTSRLLGFNKIGGGVYHYNITASAENYVVKLVVTYHEVNFTRQFSITGVSASPDLTGLSQLKIGSKPSDVEYPIWVEISELDKSNLIFRFGESMEINATAAKSTNLTIYFTSFPQEYYELTNRALTYVEGNMTQLDSTTWTYTFTPNDTEAYSAGTYIYFIVAQNTSSNGLNPSAITVGSFIVLSAAPSVDNSQSTVGNTPIDSLQTYTIGDITLPIFQGAIGSPILMTLKGSDLEDNLADMRGFVWMLDVVLYYFNGLPLIYQSLDYSSSNDQFQGTLTIQSSFISTPAGQVQLRDNYAYTLILILMDSDGETGLSEQIIFVVSTFTPFFSTPFFFTILALIVVMSALMYVQRRTIRKRREEMEAQIPPYEEEMFPAVPMYCPFCGAEVSPGDVYCLKCGNLLPKWDEFDVDEEGEDEF